MADTRLGKIGITVKEPWAADISYEVLDVTLYAVEDGGDGCSYTALRDNIGVTPGTDPNTWVKSTQAGQSIYDLAVKYHHFVGTEEEFEADYQAALQAARDAAAGASAVEAQVEAAETARVAAETGRADAESARQSAEASRASAETARGTAETARQSAEASRASAETARVTAEQGRVSAESDRVSAEAARAAAETDRVSDFSALKTDMETAIGQADAATAAAVAINTQIQTAEEGRVSAEQGRVSAENARASAESARATAESRRATAETARATAEEQRATAEGQRVTAENARVSAESGRDTAESARATAEASRVSAENARESQASSDHTRAESDHAIVQGYDNRLTNVEGEVSQLGQEKVDKELADDVLYITDASRNIIAQIDADGVSTIDVKVKVDGELVSVKSLLSALSGSVATEQARAEAEEGKKLDHTLADNKFIITDADGNIIVKVDKDGIHSAMSKHAVACMVFGEYYYPTSAPTRDANGNITHAEVMFGTGVAGSVDITYSGVNAVQVLAHYGDYTYTVTIQRDENGNVEVVSVN